MLTKLEGYTLVRQNAPGYSDDGTQYIVFTRDLPYHGEPGQKINGIEGTWVSHHDLYVDDEARKS